MKNIVIFALSVSMIFVSCKKEENDPVITPDSVKMEANYANDVYYSLDNGTVATVSRTNWDIAFNTSSRTSTIITNAGANIKLYTYKGADINAWSSINITSIPTTWAPMYNADTTWLFGAFERNAIGHPDYGWGIYNTINHDVVGDSVFIIKLQDGSLKKLWIVKKASTENKYIFKFANADNTGTTTTDTVDCSKYTTKNFIYYSFATKNEVDREPAKDTWDFVITKYYEMIPDNNGVKTPYNVTGILTNAGLRSAQIENADTTITDYSSAKFVTSISEIGSDWKSFDMNANKWNLANKRVYFIEKADKGIYKLFFTGFEGSTTGVIKFSKSKLN